MDKIFCGLNSNVFRGIHVFIKCFFIVLINAHIFNDIFNFFSKLRGGTKRNVGLELRAA